MHWLQAGGAERWGMETIALAKEAGFIRLCSLIVIVISHGLLIQRATMLWSYR